MYIYTFNNVYLKKQKNLVGIMASNANIAVPPGVVLSAIIFNQPIDVRLVLSEAL